MPSVLVTGASRGIGRSIVTALADNGWHVFAGVRNTDDAADIAAVNPHRISTVMLDVTNADHVAAIPEMVGGRLDAVVNNAGIVVPGPLETIGPDDLRRQFDVNVIGHLSVTRAVLPLLRESSGRVVFISSLNGRIAVPLMGAYCASKFALEAAADALRMELAPWRIPVVVVQPTQTDTDMVRNAASTVEQTEAAMTAEYRDLYADHIGGMKKFIGKFHLSAVPAKNVAAVVVHALSCRKPRARYIVGIRHQFPTLQAVILPNLPASLRDRLLRRLGSQPGRAGARPVQGVR